MFLSSLEERQKECRLYVDDIGDIIQTHMSKMGIYMVQKTKLWSYSVDMEAYSSNIV